MLVVATIGLFGAGAPAHGDSDELDYWVQWADNQNQVILNEFTNAALSACTMADLKDARATADAKLDVVWNRANSEIDQIVSDNLSLEARCGRGSAQLLIDHDEAHDEVATTYASWQHAMSPCPTTTTSTTAPGTTTTDVTDIDHHFVDHDHGAHDDDIDHTTTTEPTTTTTTSLRRPCSWESHPPNREARRCDPTRVSTRPAMADPVIGVDDAMTSALVFDADGIVMNDGMGDSVAEGMAHTGTVSGMFTAGASVVLPPGLVQKAVGPIIAMEFLVRTLIDSLGTMIVPLTVFLMAAGIVVWRESRRSAPIAG
jgi:hypothetical protein